MSQPEPTTVPDDLRAVDDTKLSELADLCARDERECHARCASLQQGLASVIDRIEQLSYDLAKLHAWDPRQRHARLRLTSEQADAVALRRRLHEEYYEVHDAEHLAHVHEQAVRAELTRRGCFPHVPPAHRAA